MRKLRTQLISLFGQTVGPVHPYCAGPTFCPHRLISCVQLAQIPSPVTLILREMNHPVQSPIAYRLIWNVW